LEAAEADLTTWSDDRLLDRAIRAYHQGDCLWALRLYRELRGRPLEPADQVAALYNQGMCLELGRFWEDAASSYEELLQRHPDADAARDALFRLGVSLEVRGRFAEAAACFHRILRRYPDLLPHDRRAVQVQIAWQEVMQGQDRRALKRLRRVQAEWTAQTGEASARERFYQGKARIALGLMLSRYGEALELTSSPLDRVLGWGRTRQEAWTQRRMAELEARFNAAGRHYDQALQQRTPIWSSAALYLHGRDAEAFYHKVLELPPPAWLTPSQQTLFRSMLRERLRPYLVRAAHYYLKGLEVAQSTGDDSGWARWLALRVKQLDDEGIDGLATDRALETWKGDLGGARFR